ncbi:MAG: methylase involved in ubiquinone/menaquinone biosynthesis [Symbiobacteriaceae bacterium]|nr:methylase involved in ubiquinone/menaquinone biosynthesis [Symbiobacteriaceae bacterium]
MNLHDILHRITPPVPWSEGDNIPWNDPDFSRRMLKEHLSQSHDAASRRFPIIDGQVGWIHTDLLGARPSRILDLGCGPGLYANRLARHGHTCLGIDFSPASIAYAREHAAPSATFIEGDLRTTAFGDGYDLVMLLFGEFNVFRPADAREILRRAHAALAPGGHLLLEVSTHASLMAIGGAAATWSTRLAGLWSDRPYLCLEESFWDETAQAATTRYYVVDGQSGTAERYASSYQAYTDDGYRTLLAQAGFTRVELLAAVGGAPHQEGFLALTAER